VEKGFQPPESANYDVKKAGGFIYIDEIDNPPHTRNVSITRDVFGGRQCSMALPKISRGTTCNVPPRGGPRTRNREYLQLTRRNLLFICRRAFVGLRQVIKKTDGPAFARLPHQRQGPRG